MGDKKFASGLRTASKAAQDQLGLAATVFESAGKGVFIADAKRRLVAVQSGILPDDWPARRQCAGPAGALPDFTSPRRGILSAAVAHRRAGRRLAWRAVGREQPESYPQWASLTALCAKPMGISAIILVCLPISARKAAEARVHQLVHFDSLTSLPNRVLLQQCLPDMLNGHRYTHRGLGVLFIDLDRFKNINDTLWFCSVACACCNACAGAGVFS